MNCPKCGYLMSDLDLECPRCKRLGNQGAQEQQDPQQQPPQQQVSPSDPGLLPCRSCGNPISNTAKRCPHCGCEHTPAGMENTGMALMGCVGYMGGAAIGAILMTLLRIPFFWGMVITGAFGIAGAVLLAKGQYGRFTSKR